MTGMATIKVDQLAIDDTLLIRKEREEFTKNLTKEMETFSTHSSYQPLMVVVDLGGRDFNLEEAS